MENVRKDRPVGVEVSSEAALLPGPIVMEGRTVILEPLCLDHADELFEVTGGLDRAYLWDYMLDGPFTDKQKFRDGFLKQALSSDAFYYAFRNKATGKAIGFAGLMRIDRPNRSIEVGYVMFSPLLQRTTAATECMYLLARYAFEKLGYRRYEWKCHSLNQPSWRAALRLGFVFEGVFRQHMVVKGRNRDTAWFSILDTEWPAVKKAYEAWLDPVNFDEQGNQRIGLADLHKNGKS